MAEFSDLVEKKLAAAQGDQSAGVPAVESRLQGAKTLPASEMAGADAAGQADLGPPGLKSPLARLSISQANTLKEKVDSFVKLYPQGKLLQVPETGELIFRKDPSQPFSKVEGPEFEPLNDVIDFFGEDIGAILGETAAMAGRAHPLGLMATIIRLFGGAASGEIAQQAVQLGAGVQDESLGETGDRALAKGAVSAGFGGAGRVAGSAIQTATGGGLLARREGATEAMQAAQELGLPPLLPGNVSTSPLLKRMQGQAAAMVPTVEEYMVQQRISATNVFDQLRRGEVNTEDLKTELTRFHNRERGDILTQAATNAVDLESGGKALQKGIERYDHNSQYAVDELYRKAREIADPEFDISEMQDTAREIQEGIRAAGAEAGSDFRVSESPSAQMAAVVDDVLKLQEGLPAQGDFGPVEQLRALRQRLWDLKTPPMGERPTAQNFMASRLYASITGALKNPRNADPAFKGAWDKANSEAAKRFQTMDQLLVIRAAKTQEPAKLAEALARPNEIDNLKLLRRILPSREFAEFQDSFKTNLLSKPDRISGRLDEFDAPTLNLLLSPIEQRTFQRIGAQIDRLRSTKIRQMVDRQTRLGPLVEELMFRGDTATVDQLASLIQKAGKESPLGDYMRGALLENIIRKTVHSKDGVPTINHAQLVGVIEDMNERGLNQFLTPSDYTVLKRLDKVLPFISQGADAGTSIAASEAASGLRGILTGDVTASAVRSIMESIGMGNFLTSKWGQWLLVGNPKAGSFPKNELALAAAILGTTADNFDSVDASSKRVEEKLSGPALIEQRVGGTGG